MFPKASGLKINLNKCELMPVHQCQLTEANNIPIKSKVKYLGMLISKDSSENELMNVWNTIDKCQIKLL